MNEIPRHRVILDLLEQSGQVKVDALSERLNVSEQTIRKDLKQLELGNNLVRFHGGARRSAATKSFDYEARRLVQAREKTLIAKAVADLIPDKSTLFINIGTTTEAVSKALSMHKGLMVVTDNVNVANTLRVAPEIQVIIAGGIVRSTDGAIVGEEAVEFIRKFKVDYAIIGVSAIDADGSLLDHDFREVQVVRAIMEGARHVILAADSSKFERKASIRIGHLSDVDTFVTDRDTSIGIKEICEANGVNLICLTESLVS